MQNNTINSTFKLHLHSARSIVYNYSNARKVYERLYAKFESENKRNWTFRDVVSSAISCFCEEEHYDFGYFRWALDRLSYELAMHIFWIAQELELQPDNETLNYIDTHKRLSKALKSDPDNLSKQYSSKRKKFFTNLGIDNISYDSRRNSENEEKRYTSVPLFFLDKPKFSEYVGELSYLNRVQKKAPYLLDAHVLSVQNHSHTLFSHENGSDGIVYSDFRKILNRYVALHGSIEKETSFQSEISAFLAEKTYYLSSYSFLVTNYAATNITTRTPDIHATGEDYFALNSYARIFDTHYPSLTEYIITKYGLDTQSYFSNNYSEDDKINIFLCHEKYQSFYLPLLYFVMLAVIYELFNGDVPAMVEHLSMYLKKQSIASKFTYRKRLLYINDYLNYAEDLAQKKTEDSQMYKKHSIFYRTNRADSKEYQTSRLLSRMFFNGGNPYYLGDVFTLDPHFSHTSLYPNLYQWYTLTRDSCHILARASMTF